MVSWLEECAWSSRHKHIAISLKKIVFFSFERNGFLLQQNASMIWAGTLKGAVLRGDCADDHTQKRKQAQVARKPNKI